MTVTYDPTTNRGKVRLLISDIDTSNAIFQDADIDAFLAMASGSNVKRAAATALLSIAANEVLVQKRIQLLDLSTDGPAEAVQLRELAKQYRSEAETEELADSFGWAEQVHTPSQYSDRLWKEAQRGN